MRETCKRKERERKALKGEERETGKEVESRWGREEREWADHPVGGMTWEAWDHPQGRGKSCSGESAKEKMRH